MRPKPVNLVDVIKNLTKMLRRIIGEDILLKHVHDGHAPFVQADVGMIEQVLLNLVVNARDAMPDGGELLISTKKLRLDSEYVLSNAEASAGEFICLRVRDTGCGIAPEHMARLFEPFFTTKEVGKGTGLGLATVYGIVKQHGGWIRVSSRVGVGTVFRIFLPAIEPPVLKVISPEAEPAARNGSERILLVEDDAAVRLAIRRMLGAFGYQVVEAASGREALEIWRSQERTINLLLTDLVMPGGVTGRDLAEELRKQNPRLKVIFVSGYSSNVIGKDTDFLHRENNYFLQKPFQANVLMDTVRRCLDEAPAPAP
jgi:two-component system cell cycle sensor histidine kinase/response regulator CckA